MKKTWKKRRKHQESGLPNCWEEGADAFFPAFGPAPASRLEARLGELQSLLAAGLITPQEYEALKAEALAQGEE